MPYISKWVSGVLAVAYVMRVDKCDRAAAMRQIEAAALDAALRWHRGGSNRWDWDAKVFRADLMKLWPAGPAKGDSAAQLKKDAVPAEAETPSDLRKLLEAARRNSRIRRPHFARRGRAVRLARD